MIDSHCHLDDEAYEPDRNEVITRAKQAGITGIVVPGFELAEWPRLPEVCRLDPMICCGLGLHPWYLHELSEGDRTRALAELPERARAYGAVAIGECGLDALKAKRGGAPLSLQQQVLDTHLEVADALHLPVILHCVHAHQVLLEQLERRGGPKAGGVMHSYSGSAELIPRYARLGLFFSFAGIITRENAKRPRRALAAVPLSRLMFESDGPDQAPQDAPSRRSEPAYLGQILEVAAEVRTQARGELARASRDNARKLFAI